MKQAAFKTEAPAKTPVAANGNSWQARSTVTDLRSVLREWQDGLDAPAAAKSDAA